MKHNQGLILSATVLATLAMGVTTLTANAATTYKRSKISKVSSKAYYSKRQKGKTYQFKGTAKKLTFKANHALKNYTKTTWQASKKTTVTKHGKQYLYYYVKNSRNGATGWVYSKYLKAGKNFQATTPTTTTTTTYTPAKAGKVYILNGDNTYVKFSNGQALKTGENYTQTQQRYVYKAGKKYLYYFVTSADKKVSGWTWHGYLKADSSTSASTTTTTNTNNTTTTGTNNTDSTATDSSVNDSTPVWATDDGQRARVGIPMNDLKAYLKAGHQYNGGLYAEESDEPSLPDPLVLVSDISYGPEKNNAYSRYDVLQGTANGSDFVVEASDDVVQLIPKNGDALFQKMGNTKVFASLSKPEVTTQYATGDKDAYKMYGPRWFQYNLDGSYTDWVYNLDKGQWESFK
ncbi:hypothetical protein ACFP3T_01820 [Lactiplantibacillus dongliensis]|uniref:Surface layer protein A domain-containing protein n=1 Tax=Lactiplantibacillus dongliensis TaxID=2559919 RepID=A0ABW1R0Q3_9LACO|nr:hypothetical protein [Lactiplantibacillus dongliensis]